MQLENPIQLENNQRSSSQTSNSATTIREPGITFLQSTFTWPYLKCSKILIILHFEFELQRLSSWTIPASAVRMRLSTKQLPTFCTQLVSSVTENNSSWSVFLKTARSPFQTSLRLPGRLQVCSGFPTQCQLKHAFYFGVLCFRFGTAVDYNSSSGVDFEQRTAAASRATSAAENQHATNAAASNATAQTFRFYLTFYQQIYFAFSCFIKYSASNIMTVCFIDWTSMIYIFLFLVLTEIEKTTLQCKYYS